MTGQANSLLRWSLGLALAVTPPVLSAEAPSAERRQELTGLLLHDCGSCHGLTLQGGLGPPLTPDRLQDKPADFLAVTILYGRPGTPMPPWRPFLTDAEAQWLAQTLKEGL